MVAENFFKLRTIRWEDGAVVAIDQRLLPRRLEYIRMRTVDQIAEAIENMAIRGAPAISVAAAFGLALVAYRSKTRSLEELRSRLHEADKFLRSTRPTAVNLFWALDRVMSRVYEAGSVEEVKEAVLHEALAIWREDYEVNKRIGDYGATLLEDGDRVLTHCKWL